MGLGPKGKEVGSSIGAPRLSSNVSSICKCAIYAGVDWASDEHLCFANIRT